MPKKIPQWLKEDLDKKGGLKNLVARMPSRRTLTKEIRIHAALSDPTRMKILCFLGLQRSCVCLIREVVNLTYSKLSYHLSIMKKAKLITGKKEGNYVIYSLTDLGKKYYEEICKEKDA